MERTVRRVGVLAPMPSELAPVVKAMGLRRAEGAAVHTGRIGTVEVVATRTGIGLTLAAEATVRLLDADAVDHVMVVGIAGGIGPARVGDVLCPETAVDRVRGVRYDATPLAGELAGVVSSFRRVPGGPRDGGGARRCRRARARHGDLGDRGGMRRTRRALERRRAISDLADDHPDAAVLGLANADGTPDLKASMQFLVRNPKRVPGLVRLARDSTRAACRRGGGAPATPALG